MSVGSTSALMGVGFPAAQAAALGRDILDSITAFAGGGQGSATALTGTLCIVATCATGGDSVLLPTLLSYNRAPIIVVNLGAASCDVFPATGQAINGSAANSQFAVGNGKVGIFWPRTFSSTGKWLAMLGA